MLEAKFIPVKWCGSSRKKPLWMTHRARKAVKKRCQVYKKYKDVTHPAYVQAQRQAKFLIKKAKKEFEFKLAKKITGQEIFFLHTLEAKVVAKSKLEQLRTVRVNCTVNLKLKLKC